MVYPVTAADIVARWRPLDASETAVATVLLVDAEVMLDRKRPGLAAAVALLPGTAGHVPVRLVVAVLADMVQRVLRNPDVQSSLQLGADGSISQSFPAATVNVARPRLEVSEYDLATLVPAPLVGVPVHSVYSVPYGTL